MTFDPTQLAVTLLLGVSVFLVVWSVFRFPVPADAPLHRRIALAMGKGQRQTVFEQPLLEPIMNLALTCSRRMNIQSLRDAARKALNGAGNPNAYSVEEYLAVCMVCGIGFALATAFMSTAFLGGFNLLAFAFMGVLGFYAPLWSLKGEARARMGRIARQLPYTLDLIALMMGAGSTFTEAVQTIIREDPDDDFNQELRIVLSEIEFGTKRATALSNMANRIPMDALRSIVGAVNQAEMLGTPLAEILKSQSNMLRMHRSVEAEKVSASASLRILVPTMLILVAVVIFLFGPLIIRWMRGELM